MDREYRSIRNLPAQPVDEEYISVRDGPRLNRLARRPELEALFSKASLISDLHLDIIDALKTAREAGIITSGCERDFRRRIIDQREATVDINIKLLFWIVSNAQDGICDVLIFLKLIGHRPVAMEIENAIYGGLSISEVGSASIHNAKAVETFYYNWKRHIDNNVFPDRLAALRWMNGELETRMSQGDNYSRRQLNANKYVFLHILCMPIMTDSTEREATLNTMKQSVPADLDHAAVDLVYTGCMAWSSQMHGNMERTFERVRPFQTLIALFSLPFFKCLFYILAEGTYRRLALAHPENREYRRLCIFFCEQGLQMCQDFDEEKCMQQRRMLVMSIVYVLLGVHANLKVEEALPDAKLRMLAKDYLKEMRKSLFKGIETRREVVYYLCMARLYEAEDADLAIEYARKSLQLAEDSSITDESRTNITEYKERLENR